MVQNFTKEKLNKTVYYIESKSPPALLAAVAGCC